MSASSHNVTNEAVQFEALYRAYYNDLYRYAVVLLRGYNVEGRFVSGKAEEVVQETFSIAWEKRSALFSSPAPVGWLYKALHYKVKENVREERKWTRRLLRLSDNADDPNEGDFRLRAEMQSWIPREDYLILKQLYLDGKTFKELSAQMGIKTSTLAMRVKRMKARLCKQFFEL